MPFGVHAVLSTYISTNPKKQMDLLSGLAITTKSPNHGILHRSAYIRGALEAIGGDAGYIKQGLARLKSMDLG